MTRNDLERRLAEHFEPESTLPRASFDALSPARLWRASNDALRRAQEARNTCALWTPEMFTRDGNAMLALVRAAADTSIKTVLEFDPFWPKAWASKARSEPYEEMAMTVPMPLAVAIAIARAVGVLGADEEVTHG